MHLLQQLISHSSKNIIYIFTPHVNSIEYNNLFYRIYFNVENIAILDFKALCIFPAYRGKNIMVMEKDYNLMVGLRIREIRESLRLSREKFSEKCDISPSFLADIERGKKSLTAKTVYKICAAYNISADYIVLGHKEGFDRDIGIEVLNSFNDEQLEHIIKILYEIRNLSQPNTPPQTAGHQT